MKQWNSRDSPRRIVLHRGYDVTGVDIKPNSRSEAVDSRTIIADLNKAESPVDIPVSVDLVVHLAANARVHILVNQPTLAKQNFNTTFTMLEKSRDVGAHFILYSNRDVYGNQGQRIFDETGMYVDQRESPFTASKIGGEALVNSYNPCYDMGTTIVKFSNVYGQTTRRTGSYPCSSHSVTEGRT